MDKELVERLLTEIRKARRAGIKTEELLFLGDYDAIQDALIWMHDKGLIIGVPLDELGDNVGDIWLSTITTAGRDYHCHHTPPASAARRLHLDRLPHQPPGQIAGRVAVGLAQLGTVYAVEPHSHSPPVWLPDEQAVTVAGREDDAGLGRRRDRDQR